MVLRIFIDFPQQRYNYSLKLTSFLIWYLKFQSVKVYRALHRSSRGEIRQECKPQRMVVPHAAQREIDGEEDQHRYSRGGEHAARVGGADEHAVPDERRQAADRYQHSPRSIVGGGSHDVRLVGEQSEKARAAHGVDESVGGGERCAPSEEAAHRATELLVVARAVVLAAERLAGKGEAVHHV